MTQTPFQLHVSDWKDCKRCPLHRTRQHVVLYRGKIPCDVLFVGEAPGDSEDVLGKPFKGPAGKLLDDIIAGSLPSDVRVGITNVVGCIPYDEDSGEKMKAPPRYAIEACSPRLQQIIAIAKPKLIVAVGGTAEKALPGHRGPGQHQVSIVHPAALLRMNEAQFGLEVQRSIIVIRTGWKKSQESTNAGTEEQPRRDKWDEAVDRALFGDESDIPF